MKIERHHVLWDLADHNLQKFIGIVLTDDFESEEIILSRSMLNGPALHTLL